MTDTTQRDLSELRTMIEPMIVISTGNLSEATRQRGLDGELGLRTIPHEYGFICHVPDAGDDDDGDSIPEDLDAALGIARAMGCNWINFDCDGSVICALAYYD
jgi:hypothetical protein